MSSYLIGHGAEERAARYLDRMGFKVRQLNWSTKYCEIDIIAERSGCVYFVEVKFRRSTNWGHAVDYVTPKKLARMRFAADYWLAQHNWRGSARLAVVGIDDSTFRLELLND